VHREAGQRLDVGRALATLVGAERAAAHQQLGGRGGERAPDIEPLTRLTVHDVMTPNPDTIGAERTLEDAAGAMIGGNRRWAPVLDDHGAYAGLLALADIGDVPRPDWGTLTVAAIARADVPPVRPTTTVLAVGEQMRATGTPAVAVFDEDGHVIGVVTARDVANVEVLLDRLSGDAG
jgi:CBS domain-containing protein